MDPELEARLDMMIVLLVVIASGVLGLAWAQGGLVAALTVFGFGAILAALIRRPTLSRRPGESDL